MNHVARDDDWKTRLLSDRALSASIRHVVRAHSVPWEDVDDLVQDTLLAVQRADLPADEGQAKKYIHGIAAHISRDYLRAGKRRATEDIDACPEADLAVHGPAHEQADLARRVAQVAEAEAPRAFQWFWRSRVLDETHAEIAKSAGVTEAYVRHEVADARGRMRALALKLGVPAAAALALLALLGRHRPEAPLPAPAPTIAETAQPTATATVGVRERAAALRQRAHDDCRAERWIECRDGLDEARLLDPDGESDPQVRADRAAILHAMTDVPRKPRR